MNAIRRLALFTAACVLSVTALAQQQFPTLEKGFQPGKMYDFGSIDNVNVFNGALVVSIPVGLAYPMDGGWAYQLRLTYNSNPWDLHDTPNGVHSLPSPRANAGFGWTLGYGRYFAFDDPANLSGVDIYESPDGADHRFNAVQKDTSCTVPCPSYTSDGSNLRLRNLGTTAREVDFPNGTVQRFDKIGSAWRLTSISSKRSTDRVTISELTTNIPASCPAGTTMYWSITDTKSRAHQVCFTNRLVDGVNKPFVQRVVTQAAGSRTVIHDLVQAAKTIPKAAQDTDPSTSWRQTHDVQVLTAAILPDGSRFSFTGDERVTALTLPTGGQISYAYLGSKMPSTSPCANTYGLGFAFGSSFTGVSKRTMTPAVPTGQTATPQEWTYSRGTTLPVGTHLCESDPTEVWAKFFEEFRVTVTEPTGLKTLHHYSAWADSRQASPGGFLREHHSLPYGKPDSVSSLPTRYLSREVSRCVGTSCTPLQEVWVRHDHEATFEDRYSEPWVSHRPAYERTVFLDDPASCVSATSCKYIEQKRELWDEYGHYKKITTNANFGNGGDGRIVTTAWNEVGGVARVIRKADNWTPDVYESVKTEQATILREQACFNLTTGLPRGKRTLKGTSPGVNDLLTS